jgi:hypothetical protein
VWAFAIVILAYELLHLVAEASMRATPSGNCRAVVILPARRPRDLRRFVGVVDYVVVDDEVDAAAAEAAGLRWILNKYEGKSGALATALEEVEADLYVFIDDDAYPGRWLEVLRRACGRFATAYRWVLDRTSEHVLAGRLRLDGVEADPVSLRRGHDSPRRAEEGGGRSA